MSYPKPSEHYRNNHSSFVEDLMKHYEREVPEWINYSGFAIQRTLSNAFCDAGTLDENAAQSGNPTEFLASFLDSVFHDEGFFKALLSVSLKPLNEKVYRAALSAQEIGEDTMPALILAGFREKLKDGWTVGDALRFYGAQIGEEFAKGNHWLLERLAESSREVYTPKIQRLIVRAWLPLALWQNVPTAEKERRLLSAWKTLKDVGFALPDWCEPTHEEPYRLAALLRDAKKTLVKV